MRQNCRAKLVIPASPHGTIGCLSKPFYGLRGPAHRGVICRKNLVTGTPSTPAFGAGHAGAGGSAFSSSYRTIPISNTSCSTRNQAIGKSRGGLTTKIAALVDALGNVVCFGCRVDRHWLAEEYAQLSTFAAAVGHPCLSKPCARCAMTAKGRRRSRHGSFPHERLEALKSIAMHNPPRIARRMLRPLEDQSRRSKSAHRGVACPSRFTQDDLRDGGTIPEKALQFYGNQLSHFLSKCPISLGRSSPLLGTTYATCCVPSGT